MTVSEAVEQSRMYLTELRPELRNADVQLEELEVPPNKFKVDLHLQRNPGAAYRIILGKNPSLDPHL